MKPAIYLALMIAQAVSGPTAITTDGHSIFYTPQTKTTPKPPVVAPAPTLAQKKPYAWQIRDQRYLYLWKALRTRVVTNAEMEEILARGWEIVPAEDGGYAPSTFSSEADLTVDKAEAEKILQNAVFIQFKMRLLVQRYASGTPECAAKAEVNRAK